MVVDFRGPRRQPEHFSKELRIECSDGTSSMEDSARTRTQIQSSSSIHSSPDPEDCYTPVLPCDDVGMPWNRLDAAFDNDRIHRSPSGGDLSPVLRISGSVGTEHNLSNPLYIASGENVAAAVAQWYAPGVGPADGPGGMVPGTPRTILKVQALTRSAAHGVELALLLPAVTGCSVDELQLQDFDWRVNDVNALCTSDSGTKRVRIQHGSMSDAAVHALARDLVTAPTLGDDKPVSLLLDQVDISPRALQGLFASVARAPKLISLGLVAMQMRNNVLLNAFTQSLSTNHSLHELDLSWNTFSLWQWKELCRAVREHCSLRILKLNWISHGTQHRDDECIDELSRTRTTALLNMVQANPNIQEIQLEALRDSDYDTALLDCLQSGLTVRRLYQHRVAALADQDTSGHRRALLLQSLVHAQQSSCRHDLFFCILTQSTDALAIERGQPFGTYRSSL